MKKLSSFYTLIILLLLTIGSSSCYVGFYSPGVRCVGGPRFRPIGPRYYHPIGPRHHHYPNRMYGRRVR
jgi:hypothetical protein